MGQHRPVTVKRLYVKVSATKQHALTDKKLDS